MILKDMLPDWYDGILELEVVMNLQQENVDLIAKELRNVQSNQYISTANIQTIKIYENLLKINSNPNDSLDVRRFRVLTRLTGQKPYTFRYLQELLSSFSGPASLTMLYNEYKLVATINFEQVGQLSEVEYLFRSIVPANIIYDINNTLNFNSKSTNQYLSAGMVASEMVVITQDLIETSDLSVMAHIANANVVSNVERWSADTQKSNVIEATPKNSPGVVFYETVEIH